MTQRLFILLIALMGFATAYGAPVAAADSIPDDEEDVYFLLMGQADEAIAAEDYPGAIAILNDVLKVYPDNPSNVLVMSNLGLLYSATDQDSLALDILDRALEIAPSMRTLLQNRARVRLKSGDDIGAYRDYSTLIEIDSIALEPRYYRGMIALYGGKAEQALSDFEVLRRLAPESFDTAAAFATYYSLMRNDAQAIPYYKKLLHYDAAAEYFAALAGCYLATDDLGSASDIIARGLNLYPNDGELYYYRAWLNRERFRPDDAHADAKRALELGVNPARVSALFEKR